MFFLPLYELRIVDEALKKKQTKVDAESYHEYIPNSAELSIEQLNELQKDFFEYKKSFEEKAKISIVGITIAISIIFAWTTFLDQFYDGHNVSIWVTLIIIILSAFSLFNMLVASFLSLKMIGDMNVFYKLQPTNFTLEEGKKKKKIAQYIEHNYIYNLRRNNYLYASFKSLLISIITFVVVFCIILLPIHRKKEVNNAIKGELESINSNLLNISENLLKDNDEDKQSDKASSEKCNNKHSKHLSAKNAKEISKKQTKKN